MKNYFITATGTGIGKTLLTCALAYQLRTQGRRVRALKPVISGFDAAQAKESDTGLLLAAQEMPVTPQSIETLSPWRFTAPLSPDMAAQDEKRTVDFARLVAFCRQQKNGDYLLIEGVGGVMAPLDAEQHTVLDWMLAVNFPVILVTGSYLGTLSHTLTAAHAITSAGLNLHAVILCESEASPAPLARTEDSLRRFLSPGTPLHSIARLDSSPQLWKYVPDITRIFPL